MGFLWNKLYHMGTAFNVLAWSARGLALAVILTAFSFLIALGGVLSGKGDSGEINAAIRSYQEASLKYLQVVWPVMESALEAADMKEVGAPVRRMITDAEKGESSQ